jgi:hypothetical protein
LRSLRLLVDRFWAKVDKTRSCWVWTAATTNGYGVFRHDGKNVGAHQMAWLLAGYELPPLPLTLDHVCRNRRCVRIDHLRVATRTQQQLNTKLRTDNKSGFRGVSWRRDRQKWRVTVMRNKRQTFGGYYDNLEDAIRAAKSLQARCVVSDGVARRHPPQVGGS